MRAHWWLTVRIFTMWLFSTALILDTPARAQVSKTVDGRSYSRLSWSDEFNGSSINPNKWVVLGPATDYMARQRRFDPAVNPPFVRNGVLFCPIRYVGGKWYASAVSGINWVTQEAKHQFGVNSYIEIRVKMPKGMPSLNDPNRSGIWSAGWLMPTYPVSYYHGWLTWPMAGEIDWWETQWERIPSGGDRDGHVMWTTIIQSNNSDLSRSYKAVRYLRSQDLGYPDWYSAWHVTSFHRFNAAGAVKMIFRIDGKKVAEYDGGNFTGEPTNWWKGGENDLISKYPKVAWGGPGGTGPVGSPFDKSFSLMFWGMVKGYGPLTMEDVNPNPNNNGQALQVDYVRVYRP